MARRRFRTRRRFRKKRRTRFKRGRRRRRFRATFTRVRGVLQSDALMVKLRFFNVNNPPSTSPTTSAAFRMNSAQAPNPLGPAQPGGWDQYALLYGQYQVLGSKINIKVSNQSSTTSVYWALYPTDLQSPAQSPTQATSQAYAKTRISGVHQSGNSISSATSYMTVKKFIGRTTSSDIYGSPTDSNPTEEYFWLFTAASEDGTNQNIAVYTTITYYVKFWDRKQPVDIVPP